MSMEEGASKGLCVHRVSIEALFVSQLVDQLTLRYNILVLSPNGKRAGVPV